MRIIAIIPAFNEAPRIGHVVRGLLGKVEQVIVVDDGSTDGTAKEAAAAGATVLSLAVNRGQGAALRAGTGSALSAGADVIVHFDADGQHHPDSIADLVSPIVQGRADIVFGSRFLGLRAEGMPRSRRALLQGVRQFNSLALGISRRFSDPQSGMRAFTAEAALAIDFRQDRMAHCSEILMLASRSSFRVIEVPIRVRYTADTLKKGQHVTDAAKIAWQLFMGAFR